MLIVIGVHTPKFDYEKADATVRKAMQRYGLHHPVVNDADRKIWRAYNVQSWPTLVLIDPEGFVVGGIAYEHVFESFDRAISNLIRVHRARGTLKEGPAQTAKKDPAANGPLYFPGKVLADTRSDRLFIADSTHHRIVITTLEGKKVAIAGTGAEGKADGAFDRATFSEPQGMTLHGDTLYVADRKNHLIRALDLKKQTVRTVAGTGRQAAFPPSAKAMRGGPPRDIPLNSPWDVLAVGDVLYIAMAGHHQIWAMTLTRPRLMPFAGTSNETIKDGPRAQACFAQPSGLATDGTQLYIADSETSAIRVMPLAGGNVSTLVGTGLFDFGDVDGVGNQVRLQHPLGVVYRDGKLYVADTYNGKIKLLDPRTRTVSTFIGNASNGARAFEEPGGISYADGKLYVADTNNHRIRVVDIATRQVTTLTLQGVEAPASAARGARPSGATAVR